jgi:hypothetical protein
MSLFKRRNGMTQRQRDERDLDILALNDCDTPLEEIAWITGVPIDVVETVIVNDKEAAHE